VICRNFYHLFYNHISSVPKIKRKFKGTRWEQWGRPSLRGAWGRSSLRGAQRRSNPEADVFTDATSGSRYVSSTPGGV
jgi:hypothetical protein